MRPDHWLPRHIVAPMLCAADLAPCPTKDPVAAQPSTANECLTVVNDAGSPLELSLARVV
jgi:hypothetical protein